MLYPVMIHPVTYVLIVLYFTWTFNWLKHCCAVSRKDSLPKTKLSQLITLRWRRWSGAIPFGAQCARKLVGIWEKSLNNQIGNNGVYNAGQQTKQGNIPGDSRGCIIVSPGKAVVRGYDIETIDSTIIDFDKPRETAKVTNHAPISYIAYIFSNHNYLWEYPEVVVQFWWWIPDTFCSPILSSICFTMHIGVCRFFPFAL